MANLVGDLSTLLRSVAQFYPGGIPRSLFKAVREPAKILATSYVVFVQLPPSPANEAAERKLFEAIIEKGLSLPISSADLHYFRSSDIAANIGEVKDIIAQRTPTCIVGLGSETAKLLLGPDENFEASRSKWFESEGVPVLISDGLSEIASDAAIKRRFWDDLKLVRAKLAGSDLEDR